MSSARIDSLPLTLIADQISPLFLLLCCCSSSIPRSHLQRLVDLVAAGRLQVALDSSSRFVGLESVPDAVDWLQSGRSSGKVVVQLTQQLPAVTAGVTGAGRPLASRL